MPVTDTDIWNHYHEIARVNHIKHPSQIFPTQDLLVPMPRSRGSLPEVTTAPAEPVLARPSVERSASVEAPALQRNPLEAPPVDDGKTPVWDPQSSAPLKPGINHLKIKMPTANGGTELRDVDAYVPASYSQDKPMPMAIMLDGVRPWIDDGNIEKTSGMDKVAEKLGFIAVYPHDDTYPKQTHLEGFGLPLKFFKPPGADAEAEKNEDFLERADNWVNSKLYDFSSWVRKKAFGLDSPELTPQGFLKQDETRDVRFVKAVEQSMPQLANVDKDRVYIAGFSVGGEFAQYQAAYQPNTYAGIGSIHGTLLGFEPPQPAGQKTAYFGIVSKPDAVLPMEGGGVVPTLFELPGYSQPLKQVPRWVASNGCSGNPSVETDSATGDVTTRYEASQCTSGRGVEQIVREHGYHSVDGDTEDAGLPIVGRPDRNFPAVEKMMEYLMQFKLNP